MFRYHNALRCVALIAALSAGGFGSTATAQETAISPSEPGPDQVTSSPEVVIITTPRRGPTRSTIGAPIQDVSRSAVVRTDDLNLQSPAGFIELGNRIRETARQLCARLRFENPIGVPDEFHCRRRAVENASDQIGAALLNYPGAPEIENP
jgi:UrcA family protein